MSVFGVRIARHRTADVLAPRAARLAGGPRGRRLRRACLRGRGSFEIPRARNSDSSETRSAIATAAIEGMRESRVAIDRPPEFVLVRVASAPSARSRCVRCVDRRSLFAPNINFSRSRANLDPELRSRFASFCGPDRANEIRRSSDSRAFEIQTFLSSFQSWSSRRRVTA